MYELTIKATNFKELNTKLADAMSGFHVLTEQENATVTKVKTETTKPVIHEATIKPVLTEPTKAEREEILAEFKALGVSVNKKQTTAYLKEALAKAKAKLAKSEMEAQVAEAEAQESDQMELPLESATAKTPEVKPAVTLDQVRELMKKYAVENGVDKTKALLLNYGADKLSLLSPEQLASLYDTLTGAKPTKKDDMFE